jgi:hypothetical protein
LKSYEIEANLCLFFDQAGVRYKENAERTEIDRSQTDQGRGCVVLDIEEATLGQLWAAIESLLGSTIEDLDGGAGVNFSLDAQSFWLLLWFFRNPSGEPGASWTEFVEFNYELESVADVPANVSHGDDDLVRERVAEYLEEWEYWPLLEKAKCTGGNIYIGPR